MKIDTINIRCAWALAHAFDHEWAGVPNMDQAVSLADAKRRYTAWVAEEKARLRADPVTAWLADGPDRPESSTCPALEYMTPSERTRWVIHEGSVIVSIYHAGSPVLTLVIDCRKNPEPAHVLTRNELQVRPWHYRAAWYCVITLNPDLPLAARLLRECESIARPHAIRDFAIALTMSSSDIDDATVLALAQQHEVVDYDGHRYFAPPAWWTGVPDVLEACQTGRDLAACDALSRLNRALRAQGRPATPNPTK